MQKLSNSVKEPNPHDPLSVDIAFEFKNDKALFDKKARENTLLHAV